MTIHLHHLKFFSYHGLYKEEQLLGNEYEINIDIDFNAFGKIETIEETLNYVMVYDYVKERMQQSTPLLETLAQDIAAGIRELDDRIQKVNISIFKTHPPLKGMEGKVGVSYSG